MLAVNNIPTNQFNETNQVLRHQILANQLVWHEALLREVTKTSTVIQWVTDNKSNIKKKQKLWSFDKARIVLIEKKIERKA